MKHSKNLRTMLIMKNDAEKDRIDQIIKTETQ